MGELSWRMKKSDFFRWDMQEKIGACPVKETAIVLFFLGGRFFQSGKYHVVSVISVV